MLMPMAMPASADWEMYSSVGLMARPSAMAAAPIGPAEQCCRVTTRKQVLRNLALLQTLKRVVPGGYPKMARPAALAADP
jgi:hypothetical protein